MVALLIVFAIGGFITYALIYDALKSYDAGRIQLTVGLSALAWGIFVYLQGWLTARSIYETALSSYGGGLKSSCMRASS